MWYLDFIALFSCLRFAIDSDFKDEFPFIEMNACEHKPHRVMWAQPKGENIHTIIRVQMNEPVDWVEIDLLINKDYFCRASLVA
jgi:hypothetical protein